jgi:hypothetical protein
MKKQKKYDHPREMMKLWIKQAKLERGMRIAGNQLQPYRAAPSSPRCHCL